MDEQSQLSLAAEIESAEEVIKKLKKFADTLDTEKHPNDNILTHLCDGLEKFLGYDKNSKGYTGQGIVYSDLDRLCDAVMGFLSGVLSNIYKHLGQHKDAINNAITSLESNKHGGKKGFDAAIGSVVKGVGGYNERVKESNNTVKNVVEELHNYIKNDAVFDKQFIRIQAENATGILEDAEVRKAKNLVTECLKNATKFNDALDVSTKEEIKKSIDDFNASLKAKVNNVRESVKIETERLKELSDRQSQDLTETEQKITETLRDLKVSVDCKIDAQMSKVINSIREKMSVILSELNKVNKELISHVNALYTWIEDAEKVLNAALAKVQIILNEVKVGASDKKPDEIMRAIDQIGRDVMMIYEAGNEAKQKVQTEVKTALTKVKEMDGKLKEDLWKVKEAVEQQVKGIKNKIGKLYKVVTTGEGDDASEEEKTIVEVIKHIQQKVKDIHGGSGRDPTTGLQVIRNKVNQYVRKYGKDQFGKTAEDWIQDIWGNNVVVRYWLGKYLGYDTKQGELPFAKNGESVITVELLNQVASTIKSKLEDVISQVEVTSNGKIQAQLTAVKRGITSFVEKLGEKIAKTDGTFVWGIADEISAHLMSKARNSSLDKEYLRSAVQSTLIALHSAARQAGEEIEGLALIETKVGVGATSKTASIAAEIDNVFDVADTLYEKLSMTTKAPIGQRSIPSAAQAVDSAITEVTTKLEAKLPGNGKINELPAGEQQFQGYDSFIKQTKIKDSNYELTGSTGEGSLPKAIGAIKTQVQNALEHIDEYNTFIKTQFEDVKISFKALCNDVTQAAGDGEGVKVRLQELQNKYFLKVNDYSNNAKQSVRKIHYDLSTLQGKLEDGPIKKTKNVLEFLTKAERQFPELLKQEIQKDVKDATTSLTIHARKQHVKSIKFMLEKFAEKLRSNLAELPTQIAADLEQGHKKFMKLFETIIVTEVKKIHHINTDHRGKNESPLNKAASIFKKGLMNFSKNMKTQKDFTSDYDILRPSYSALVKSLNVIDSSLHFNDEFSVSLEALRDQLSRFHPAKFGEGRYHFILEAMQKAFSNYAEELANAYISVYDGSSNINWDQANNPETTYCAKIFLTLLQPLFDGLHELRQHCAGNAAWEHKAISLTETAPHGNTITNPLGRFFQRCGYAVCSGPNKHNGELRNTVKCMGGHIHKQLDAGIRGIDGNEYKLVTEYDEKKDEESKKKHGLLKKLFDHLHDYYTVRHVSSFSAKTYPTSVYDMLQWLCGLTYNPVHETLSHDGFSALFEKPENGEAKHHLIDDMPVELEDADSLEAYPQKITAGSLSDVLAVVCHYSHDVLTTILGHGHGDGVYACEFNTNNGALMYPSNMDTLLCMICDVVNRLYRQLHFLYNQCQYNTELSGWLDCEYGKGVGGASWRCNVDQCVNLTCNQKGGQRANQNGNQKADQPCDQHPKCGVKSPLQSFLEDGLQGFLPHQLKYEKGKVVCSVKDHSSIECITPLGFSGISHMASHRATGQRIVDVLAGYCGNQMSPLTRICGLFNCVIPTPPKTLGQMFGFYCSLLVDWADSSNRNAKREVHRETAFNKAVSDADFANPETTLDMTSLFRSGKHNPSTADQSSTHLTGDLYALVRCNGKPASDPSHPCGAYLRPLCYDTCAMFSKEHADKYLSWIVYLTETFYTSLQKLLEDCQKTCGADSKKCKIGKCKKDCKTKEHPLAPSAKHNDSCRSIVDCGYIRPTFFRYGFIHNNVNSVSGVSGDAHKRTCTDFCTALGIVTKEGKTLYDIVNKTIPDFLWTIRQKFLWTTVALWLLSLLYLLCVMVGRLDVLHVRSHLRVPSSHKITAQSLLAAAQVGRLAKISYLQP